MFKFRFDQYIALALVVVLLLISTRQTQSPLPAPQAQADLIEMADLPLLTLEDPELAAASFSASLSAQAVLAVDLDSAAFLLAKNEDQFLAPASTTKIMTALVAQDLYQLDEVVTVREDVFSVGHTIGFKPGEQLTVRALLKALLINSGNDAAVILAQHHPQGEVGFMVAMNQKAQELNLNQTSLINPAGLDAAAHYTTAFELSLMARELMKNEFFRQLVKTKEAQITDVSGQDQYYLYNTNQLLATIPDVVGIKTGTTDLAGEALVTQINREVLGKKRRVLVVILGSQNRYQDARATIDWIFSHYQWREISVK